MRTLRIYKLESYWEIKTKEIKGKGGRLEHSTFYRCLKDMATDFQQSDFFEELLSDDGSFDGKFGFNGSPDSGHGSPQSFTSSGSTSTVGHLEISFFDLMAAFPLLFGCRKHCKFERTAII